MDNKKKNRVGIILAVILVAIVTLMIVIVVWYRKPTTFAGDIDVSQEDIFIDVFDRNRGVGFTVSDPEQIKQIVDILQSRKYYKDGLSLGHMGTYFQLTFSDGCSAKSSFYVNAETAIRKDPFFYTCKEDGQELIALLEKLENQVEISDPNSLERFVDGKVQAVICTDEDGSNEARLEDINQLHKFFQVISYANMEKTDEVPDYNANKKFIIKTVDDKEYVLSYGNGYCFFDGNYYKSEDLTNKLYGIMDGSYTVEDNTLGVDLKFLELTPEYFEMEISNNGSCDISCDDSFELQYYDGNNWTECDWSTDGKRPSNQLATIKKGETRSISSTFSIVKMGIEKGVRYRIVKNFWTTDNENEVYETYIYFVGK